MGTFYLLKNILAYCGYSPTSPFFFLLSECKHCDNAATNSISKNARSRMVTDKFVGKRRYGDKGRSVKYWAHLGCWIAPCYGPFSLGAFLNLRTVYFFNFPIFFLSCGQPWITETADTESADTAVHLYAHK